MTAEWKTPEAMELIRVRRAQGVSFGPIAAELGVRKNQVIGASHRANHPRGRARNPFAVPWTEAEVAILRANSDLLMPALRRLLPGRTRHSIQRKRSSLKLAGPEIGMHGRRWPERAHTVPMLASLAPQPARRKPVAAPPPPRTMPPPGAVPRSHGCQYIAADVTSRGWRFCGEAPSGPGSPWCTRHRALCYTPRSHSRVPEFVDG